MPDIANIGKSVIIRGELSGSEDLFVDGEVDGSIALHNHALTIGPNGKIRANVNAKEVIIHGRVEGNIHGASRVELKQSGVLTGDIVTQRIRIEDGAFFKGAVEIQKADGRVETQPEAPKEAAATASQPSAGAPGATPHSHPAS